MRLKILILITNLLLPFYVVQSSIDWSATKNWKLYLVNDSHHAFPLSTDSLQYLRGRPLNDDSMHLLLKTAKPIHVQNPLWMGCYLASCKDTKNKSNKIIVSFYGGFFFSVADSTYYELDPPARNAWLQYFRHSYIRLEQP